MHVVMLSDHETAGGASIAASRLAKGLCQLGHRITRIVLSGNGESADWKAIVLHPPMYLRAACKPVPEKLKKAFGNRFFCSKLDNWLSGLHPDVINIHNLHGGAYFGWSPELVGICAAHAPVVWTLHDMWSFTGRCAYSYDCRQFIKGCDSSCPTHGEYPPLNPNLIPRAWEQRHDLFSKNPQLLAVTPSRWLASLAKTGLWAKHHIEVIPNGLDLSCYHPVDPLVSREALAINTKAPVLMIAVQNIFDRRKGWNILVEALKHVRRRPLTLMILGEGDSNFRIEGIKLHRLGYISDEQKKVQAYNASDIFVHPALEDNLPNVVMEAIACGTPVVAFDTGGTAEMFHPDKTGWLADSLSPDALASILDKACDEIEQGKNMRNACRAQAEEEYDQALQAKRYSQIFDSLIERVEVNHHVRSC